MQASQINRAVDFMREAFTELSKLWWAFFDWVAVVDWRKLAITWLLSWVFSAMMNTPEPAVWYFLLSFGIKVLAGGKTGGIGHWHVDYQVASEELFQIWGKSTGTGLPDRAPGDPLPRMVLDGLLQAEFAPDGLAREVRIWWHSMPRPV